MHFFSNKYVWIPLYLYLIFSLFKKQGKTAWLSVAYLLLLFASTDQLAASVIKPLIARLRPCHFFYKDQFQLIGFCGGKYGFLSAHAANTMGLAIGTLFLLGRTLLTTSLIAWAIIIGYSRIYLGVHYPGDVLAGFFLGLTIAYSWKWMFSLAIKRWQLHSPFLE